MDDENLTISGVKPSMLIRLIVGEHFQLKEKWICISLTEIFILICTLKFLSLVYLK